MLDATPPWALAPTLTIDLAEPPGRRLRNIPAESIEKGRRLLDAMVAEAPAGMRRYAQLVRLRTANRFHTEAVSMARALDADWRWVFLANLSYDVVVSSYGCSTVALATRAGPVLARNMDWWPEKVLAQTSCLVRYERAGKFVFANAGWPGGIGVVSGLSGRGFAVVLNAVPSAKPIHRRGYPVLLHIRRTVEDATSFDDALHRFARQRLMTGCILTLVGTRNDQRVIIERTANRASVRQARSHEPLVATNHFCSLPNDAASLTPPCSRFEALCAAFDASTASREISTPELLYTLQREDIMQQITAQHVVARPATGQVELYVPAKLLLGSELPSSEG